LGTKGHLELMVLFL